MKIIPLIYFQKRKIYAEKDRDALSLKDLLTYIDKGAEVYVYDKDGVEKDKPNLCTYPKLSEHCKIWVDCGPRTLGDVVDVVMAGATSMTLRKNLWPKVDVSSIREITESNIYEMLGPQNRTDQISSFSLSSDVDGFVISSDKDKFKRDFIYDETIKNICNKFNATVIESDETFFPHWKNIGASALLIELNTWKKVKHREF
ncbi:MAG: hypothetical protein KAI20_05405 [Thermoplasmatales archaeon]|nr:hypothetical protein [Thermoplasmatales archaeon]